MFDEEVACLAWVSGSLDQALSKWIGITRPQSLLRESDTHGSRAIARNLAKYIFRVTLDYNILDMWSARQLIPLLF